MIILIILKQNEKENNWSIGERKIITPSECAKHTDLIYEDGIIKWGVCKNPYKIKESDKGKIGYLKGKPIIAHDEERVGYKVYSITEDGVMLKRGNSGLENLVTLGIKYEYVDLRLPSGNLWATCNIGASSPEEFGMFFLWADVTGHTEGNDAITSGYSYKWSTTPYCIDADNAEDSEDAWSKYTAEGDKLDLTDDAAHVLMGGNWVMPSKDDFLELIDNTTVEANVELNGVKGYKFTNKTDSSKYMFVPYAGFCGESSHGDVGELAYLWSSELLDFCYAYDLYLGRDGHCDVGEDNGRCNGYSIRGVLRTS